MAMATLAAFTIYAALWVLAGLRAPALGLLCAALALGTVFCTAMIYAQMRAVPRWRGPMTPTVFLLAAMAGGALLAGAAAAAPWLLLALAVAIIADWLRGDGALTASGSHAGTATALGPAGSVRMLESPHTGSNYLLSEMCHVVGRRHAQRLRWIGLSLACVAPGLLLALPGPGHAVALVAVLSHVAGMLVVRWLFFAQAEHVVGFYYGVR